MRALRSLCVGLVVFGAGCSSLKTYPTDPGGNLAALTQLESGVRATLHIHRIDAACHAEYRGTVQLDSPVVALRVPAGEMIYLVATFDTSSLLRGKRSTDVGTLLKPVPGRSYRLLLRYQDDIYDVSLREADGRGLSRFVSERERILEGEVLGPETEAERQVRERLAFIAWLLDSSIPIPGTRLTIGLDAIVGLVPFIGDLIGVLASSYIVAEANRLGVSRAVLTRMALNVAIEGIVGIVPLFGDLFDAGWKANQKNVRLLSAWSERPHHTERSSRLFVVLLLLGLAAFLTACGALAYALVRMLVS
jgi:hypothetical protein